MLKVPFSDYNLETGLVTYWKKEGDVIKAEFVGTKEQWLKQLERLESLRTRVMHPAECTMEYYMKETVTNLP